MLSRDRGFSLVELMVTVALGSLLLAAAMPSFTTWISNSRVRTVADALQSGLRTAQAEAQRQARNVVFFRTTSKVCNEESVASETGQFWQIRTLPNVLDAGDTAKTVQCGVLTDASSGVNMTGPTTLCFSGNGRQMASTNPGAVGEDCALDTQGRPSRFLVTASGQEIRALQILVTLGGAVRMCDPNKTQSTTAPDGCPAS